MLSLIMYTHRGSDVEEHYNGFADNPNSICDDVFNIYTSHFVACRGTTCTFVSSFYS